MRAVAARSLMLIRDNFCGLEGLGVSVGRVGSTASAKDVCSESWWYKEEGQRALRLRNAANTGAAMRDAHHRCYPLGVGGNIPQRSYTSV